MAIQKKNKINVPTDLTATPNVSAKPFLKWAGGKGQLLQKFRELYPQKLRDNKIKNYYEPFLGSGAVYFDIVQQYTIEKAWLYDINPELVLTYQVVQRDAPQLIDQLLRYQKKYSQLNLEQRQEFFYNQRSKYNEQRLVVNYEKYSETWIARAAQLIFLNRTCFNGLYRVNSKGEFNTPAGKYDNPTICDKENLLAVAKLLEKATIQRADFKQVKKELKKNAFVYFDPPYRPISKTASFKAYSNSDFTDKEQRELAELFAAIDKKGEKIMLSNSDPKNNNPKDNFFDELYSSFNIIRIPARRMINADASKRGPINEIIVTNY